MPQLLAVLVMIGLFVLILQYSKGVMARIAAAWQQAASLVGGRFHPSDGSWWRRSPMRIAADIDGTSVNVDHYTVSHGKSSTTYTRITAQASAPPELTLKIYVEGVFSTIGKALGTQDVIVGDKEFDDAFMVKASHEDLARVFIGPELRRAALATREYSLTLTGSMVTSIRVGLEQDADRLVRAIREVAIFASRGKKLLEDWRSLARKLHGDVAATGLTWPGDPQGAIQLEHHGALITIALARAAVHGDAPRLGTRVSAARAAPPAERFSMRRRAEGEGDAADPFGDPAFARAYTLDAADPARALRRFTDDLRRGILALSPEEIRSSDADVAVLLEGAELDQKRIDASIAVVSALAAPIADGPYR